MINEDVTLASSSYLRWTRTSLQLRIYIILIQVALGLLCIGCGQSTTSAPKGRPTPVSEAVRCANEILKLTGDPSMLGSLQKAIDTLVSLGEDALPGLDRILQSHLGSSLDDHPGANARVVDIILGRFTAPEEPWRRHTLAIEVDHAESEEKYMARCVRRPWLRPWLLKVLKHHFTRERRVFLWAIWYHVPNPTPDLCEFARDDPDPLVRATALIHLTKVSPLPREELSEVLEHAITEEWVASPRTVAIGVASEFRVESAVPFLVRLLDDGSTVDATLEPFLSAEVFWGAGPQSVGAVAEQFEVTFGQLAAYAIQKITGRDFGFKSCYESRNEMPQIIERIRAAYPERPAGADDGR